MESQGIWQGPKQVDKSRIPIGLVENSRRLRVSVFGHENAARFGNKGPPVWSAPFIVSPINILLPQLPHTRGEGLLCWRWPTGGRRSVNGHWLAAKTELDPSRECIT